MRQHPVIGERIIRAIPGMGAMARSVRHEHERWDGTGYPDGLAGERIPIEARIILACDAYHAMISDRPYRRAISHSEAITELTTNAGSQFDPQVVEALVGYLYGRRQRVPGWRRSERARRPASWRLDGRAPAASRGPLLRRPSLPILKIFVPQSGHVPWIAGRPFFIVTCWGSLISTFLRSFTQ